MRLKKLSDPIFEDKTLLRNFEKLGMKERVYTDEMISDAWEGVNLQEHFESKVTNQEDVTFQMKTFSDGSCSITPTFEGMIGGEFDTSNLWAEFETKLHDLPIDDYDLEDEESDNLYTVEDIESAFDQVPWKEIADNVAVGQDLTSAIDFNFSVTENNDSVMIDTSVSIDPDYGEPDQDDILTEILDRL
jgi:hypothetical protein